MLSRNENKVMSVLFNECKDKNALLISPTDLLKLSGAGVLTLTELERVVTDLHSDGYFDLVYSDRRGEKVYCICLTNKGKGYLRNQKVIKRNLIFRLFISIGFAFLSFIIGLILKAVFK